MSSTSNSLANEEIPTDRLSFLIKCGSSLAALRRKLNQRNTKKVKIIDNRNIVDEIERLKEEVKTAKESLIPPSYSLDKRGGDKVIEKFEGIFDDLIAVDGENEERYKELREELKEMKDNRGLNNIDSQKQTSGGTNGDALSYSSQVLPFGDNFEEAFIKLPPIQNERLLFCSPLAELYTREEFLIPQNVGISKGVLINWLIGIKIIDDPLEGEQFIAELLADPSFNLMCDYRSSRIIISPDFARSLASLQPRLREEHLVLKGRGRVNIQTWDNKTFSTWFEPEDGESSISVFLITINKRTYRLNEGQMIKGYGKKTLVVAHFGNFHSGMDYVVADDTFLSAFDGYLKEVKNLLFLSLRGISRIQELPRSVCEVSELKVLDLRSCQDLKSLPNDIGRLIKLVCLDLSECYQLNHIPMGIALLTNLRVLLGFIIVTDNLQQPKDPMHRSAELDDLKHLTRLIKLTIRTRRMSFPTNEDLQTLNSMQELRKLKVAWVKSFVIVQSTTTADAPSEICLDTQKLPQTLEKLELQAVPDTTASQLLELISSNRSHNRRLKKLYIRGGNLQKLYPDQHCFPQVKILHLRYLHQLHMKWNDFQLSFPNLSYLHIAECPNLILFPCNEKGEWIQSESSW